MRGADLLQVEIIVTFVSREVLDVQEARRPLMRRLKAEAAKGLREEK